MTNFWDSNVWSFIAIISILGLSLLVANLLKKTLKFLRQSLIPTSVLAGLLLLIVSIIYHAATGTNLFATDLFNGKGQEMLEEITYHCLALGFIASTLSNANEKLTKKRAGEILNTGVTTVSGYLVQAIFGLGITIIASILIKGFFAGAGVLLTFGYGQGTGQAMNYGNIYEQTYGFVGGKSFGLSIAALGFLSASIGGVIHLNILKKRGKYNYTDEEIFEAINAEEVHSPDEVSMNGSIDKLSIQIAIIFGAYLATFLIMYGLGLALPSLRSVLFGFNFLFGVIMAILIKMVLNKLQQKGIVKKKYINPFLQTRLCNFFFDFMIVAGVGAIQIQFLKGTWVILLILGLVGAFSTYFYVRFVVTKLFPNYVEEQFLVMYGMLTGTASTGMILLREVDPKYKTNAATNLVYQNVPAMVLGFPMMILATLAPKIPGLTWIIVVAYFIVLQVVLFRSYIFKKKK